MRVSFLIKCELKRLRPRVREARGQELGQKLVYSGVCLPSWLRVLG